MRRKHIFLNKLHAIANRFNKDQTSSRRWMFLYNDLDKLSVDEFARYKKNKEFFKHIHVILSNQEFDDMDLETGKWCFGMEEEDMIFDIEYTEDEIKTIVEFENGEEYELSEDKNGIIKKWLDDYLSESREEAKCWTGDLWKDNGVNKRDFYGV